MCYRLATQGIVSATAGLEDGYIVPLTLFADVTTEMAVAVEEIFGPVACVSAFDTKDEAVRLSTPPVTVYSRVLLD